MDADRRKALKFAGIVRTYNPPGSRMAKAAGYIEMLEGLLVVAEATIERQRQAMIQAQICLDNEAGVVRYEDALRVLYEALSEGDSSE